MTPNALQHETAWQYAKRRLPAVTAVLVFIGSLPMAAYHFMKPGGPYLVLIVAGGFAWVLNRLLKIEFKIDALAKKADR